MRGLGGRGGGRQNTAAKGFRTTARPTEVIKNRTNVVIIMITLVKRVSTQVRLLSTVRNNRTTNNKLEKHSNHMPLHTKI